MACLEEGIQLRKGGIRGEILILGYTPPSQVPLLRRYKLTQTAVDFSHAVQLSQAGKSLPVHLAVDTGMHRLGEPCHHLEEIVQIFTMKHLRVEGIFTHLCTADSPSPADRAYVQRQVQAFQQLLEELKKPGGSPPPRSIFRPAMDC